MGGSASAELPGGFEEELVVYRLNQPVAAEYSADGRLFIVEKQGRIRILKDGQLLTRPFLKLNVDSAYERGLLGMALDLNFPTDPFVYVYRTTAGSNPQNVVERYTASGDVAVLSSKLVLLDGIRSDTGVHNAGGLAFGPDGKLYISTGDGGLDPGLAQDLSSLNGKILRINPDGTVPTDNPFIGNPTARREIWCYGLRNPWRFAFDPMSALLFIGDVGGDKYEEINVGRPGANFGWPIVEGPSGSSQYSDPVYFYDHSGRSAAVVIGTFYSHDKFPSKYRKRLFFADYSRDYVRTIRMDASGRFLAVDDFGVNLNSPVHLLQDPDGSLLYLSLFAGEIRRIHYVGGRNRQPVAEAKASIRSGLAPLTVQFKASGSYDPDKDPLSYLWDFGDRTASSLPNVSHTYTKNGTYFALLSVRDSKGSLAQARSLKISVGNLAPVAEILSPANATVVRLGQTVSFSGKGRDREDGKIPPEQMFWSARLHHNDHSHPALGNYRGASGTLTIPSTLHAEGKLFFRLKLRVVDSGGLSGSQTVDLPLEP